MSEENATIELEPALKSIADTLGGLTLMQASKLVKYLEGEWGVSAAAPAAVMAVAGGGGAAEVEEKTSFNVILESAGAQKIQVIKEVRGITGLGLKEAKALVDGAPSPVKEDLDEAEAKEIQATLEAVGAVIELKGK